MIWSLAQILRWIYLDFLNFHFKEKDFLLYIVSFCCLKNYHVDVELNFKNCGQDLSDLGLGNGFISYLCDSQCFVARTIKCYYNPMCVTSL